MDRQLEEYPEFQQERIKNLVKNRGYSDLYEASLTRTPLAESPDGRTQLHISTPVNSNVIDLEVPMGEFPPSDLPIMDEQRMRHLAR